MNIDISNLLQRKWVLSAIGLTTFSGGLGVGYILGKRNAKVERVYIKTADTEIELDDDCRIFTTNEALTSKKEFMRNDIPFVDENESIDYTIKSKKANFMVDDDIKEGNVISIKALTEDIHKKDFQLEVEHPVLDNVSISNVGWDYEVEIVRRNPSEPYILHRDEFFNDEQNYSQLSVTYYEADDILANEQETPIYNYPSVVGQLNFGHGSGDPNVFYVRNETLRTEFEVILSPDSYEIVVLGKTVEHDYEVDDIKHSSTRKFRPE